MAKEKSAHIVWTGDDLDMTATFPAGYRLQMSGPADTEGTTPMELLLAGAAGCTAMDVVTILKKKREPLQGLEVEISAEQADGYPYVYTRGKIVYIVKGEDVSPKAVQQAVDLSQKTYCSASIMLKRSGMELTTEFRIEAM
jgi:putative redox protein